MTDAQVALLAAATSWPNRTEYHIKQRAADFLEWLQSRNDE